MSAIDLEPTTHFINPGVTGLSLWRRQLVAVIRIEIIKSLFSRGAIAVCGLALIPLVLLAAAGFMVDDWGDPILQSIDHARRIYAFIYTSFILGAVVFIGSAVIFTTSFRGEILNSSMHYYLLCPVRREILVAGKYLAALLATFGLFGTTTICSYLLLYLPYGITQLVADLVNGVAAGQLITYLGITLLGCIGYGAVFLTTGLLFRNPLLPVVVIAGWEMMHFILPPTLKMFSVINYLKGLIPIPIDDGPFAIIAAASPVWVSITGILGLAVVSLTVAFVFLKRLEISYTGD